MSLFFWIISGVVKEDQFKQTTREAYHKEMKSHREGYSLTECQVVRVGTQKIQYEPLEFELIATEKFEKRNYQTFTLKNVKDIPS